MSLSRPEGIVTLAPPAVLRAENGRTLALAAAIAAYWLAATLVVLPTVSTCACSNAETPARAAESAVFCNWPFTSMMDPMSMVRADRPRTTGNKQAVRTSTVPRRLAGLARIRIIAPHFPEDSLPGP
jgi:hypothetical protein